MAIVSADYGSMTFPSSAPAASFDVAIIGGGAAGTLVAIHLLNASRAPIRIAIIEPRPGLGQGAAYSTDYPEHLLNVVASRMSAFDSDPGHFVRFLAAPGDNEARPDSEAAIAASFAQRRDFGRYLRATLEAQPSFDRLCWLQDEAIDIERGDAYSIKLRHGDAIYAKAVVLAIGNFARPIPLPASAIKGEPAIGNAWDYRTVHRIDPDADVCIVGSGLSMVDAVVSLAANRHRGRVAVISRHGLLPLAHAAPGERDGDVDDLLALGVRERFRLIRQRATAAQRAGQPWQWTMDRLRPHVRSLWQSLEAAEQRRFLRHALRFWDIHRHRIAPSVASSIERMRASGQLEVCAGRLVSIIGDGGGSRVRFRPRGESLEREIRADHVINGTGVETSIARMENPLVVSLIERGLISPGPHGIGIATDDAGAVRASDGSIAGDLLTLGAPRIGRLWESIAIPELRGQAQRIGEYLGRSLASMRQP